MSAGRGVVRISPDAERLMSTAADLFVAVVAEAIAAQGRADVALSGGSTPRSLYRLLAMPGYAARVDWSRTGIWFGDERCVPPDDPESNYGMARDALLQHVAIPEANIHRMRGEMPPENAAQSYEDELHAAFHLTTGAPPRFDLIWLGLGADGHTASLFPGTAALAVTDRLAVANVVPRLNMTRLTLTFPVLNAAARVAFLVSGEDKAEIVARVIEGDRSDPAALLPSQRIEPVSGELLWLLDFAAAGQLHG
jgi:6-phosphogluconolactonase